MKFSSTLTKKSNRQEWQNKEGKLHNEDGPTYIYYNAQGQVIKQEYYLNGKQQI